MLTFYKITKRCYTHHFSQSFFLACTCELQLECSSWPLTRTRTQLKGGGDWGLHSHCPSWSFQSKGLATVLPDVRTLERETMTASHRGTGWVSETNGLSLRLQTKYRTLHRHLDNTPQTWETNHKNWNSTAAMIADEQLTMQAIVLRNRLLALPSLISNKRPPKTFISPIRRTTSRKHRIWSPRTVKDLLQNKL